MKLFRTKNAVKTNVRSGNPSKSLNSCDTFAPTFLQSAEDPSYAFARHVRSDPRSARRKIGSGTCPSLRAHFCGCVRVGKNGRARDFQRGGCAVVVRRVSRGTKRHARLIFSMRSAGRSTSISSGRELVTLRTHGPRRRNGRGGRDVRIHDCRKYVNTS